MSPTGKFTFKLVIYGAFLLYLVAELSPGGPGIGFR